MSTALVVLPPTTLLLLSLSFLALSVFAGVLAALFSSHFSNSRSRGLFGVFLAVVALGLPPLTLCVLSPVYGRIEWFILTSASLSSISLLSYVAFVDRKTKGGHTTAFLALVSLGVYVVSSVFDGSVFLQLLSSLFFGFFGGAYARKATAKARVLIFVLAIPAIILPLIFQSISATSVVLAVNIAFVALVSLVSTARSLSHKR